MHKVFSLDVFDTLLTRLVGQPGAVYLLLGRRLARQGLIQCSAEAFAAARAEAEHRAFSNGGGLDSHVNLERIYLELAVALGFNATHCSAIMEAELRLEAELLRPVAPMLERVAAARAAGQRIVYTSDMYLPAQKIRELLAANGVSAPDDRYYVSNEHACSKESGRLFKLLLQHESLPREEVLHIGNNAHADVRGAQRVGISAEYFAEGNLNRFEETLSEFSSATEGLAATLAGASRLARLQTPAANAHQRALRDVSAGVAAPLLVGFTLWALREATRLGLKRLYFVSRDGQIILEIARRLAPRLGIDLDLRYLYGSRQAWCLAAFTAENRVQLEQLFSAYEFSLLDHLSAQSVLARVNILPHEIAGKLAAIGLSAADWNRNLAANERQALRELLFHDATVGTLMESRAAEARALLIDYLSQEGLLDDSPFALVDLGTGGTLHRALQSVLTVAGSSPLTSLYLGYAGEPGAYRGTILPYFFSYHLRLGFQEIAGLVQIVEAVCSADHGTVLGYARNGNHVVPVLKEQTNVAVYEWGYGLVRETICRFAELVVVDEGLVNPWSDVRPVVAKTISRFWMEPTVEEAEAWGQFPFEDGWGKGSYFLRLAHPYSWSDLPRIARERRLAHHRQSWQRGSLALTRPALRAVLFGMLLLQNGRELRAIPRRLLGLRSAPRRVLKTLLRMT